LGERLHALVGELTGSEVPIGDLDISFYRDDVNNRRPEGGPVVHDSHLDFDLSGRTIVLVDDVLYTGRTVRAAIDALFDYGRPARGAPAPRSPPSPSPPAPLGCSSPYSPPGDIASSRFGPTTSARTCRPRRASAS